MLKWFLFIILALINAVLATWYFTLPFEGEINDVYSEPPVFEKETLENVLHSIFQSHKIEVHNIRERTIQPGIRTEMRVRVPGDVSLTTLNLEIHRAGRAMGYSVNAREDSRTEAVSIHIRDDHAIILTVIVVRQ